MVGMWRHGGHVGEQEQWDFHPLWVTCHFALSTNMAAMQTTYTMKETNKTKKQKKLKDGGIVAGGNFIPTPGLLSFHEYKTCTLKKMLYNAISIAIKSLAGWRYYTKII